MRCFSCGVSFMSGAVFACFWHGGLFAEISRFLMGWGPAFFSFLDFADFGVFLDILDFSLNSIK